MSNIKIDIISAIESKLNGKVQIQIGQLGTAAINTSNGLHRDTLQAMIEADEKTAITAISGLDLGANLGILYHIRTSNAFITIRAEVPKDNPKIQTISDILPGAVFHELEVSDLFGVVFEGNTLSGHFVLSEYWPEGVYPLRKDVKADEVKLNPPPAEVKQPDNKKYRKNHYWSTASCSAGARKIRRER